MEDKVTLEKDVFKTLASDTRINILKVLEGRRHTQSEIAHNLKFSIPTIKEHLLAMEKAGLVKRIDEGYKWKYYELTEKAKCILDPERKKVWILLGFWIAAAAGAGFVFISKFLTGSISVAKTAMETAPARREILAQAETVTKAPFPYVEVIVAIALAVLTILLLIFLFKSRILKKS